MQEALKLTASQKKQLDELQKEVDAQARQDPHRRAEEATQGDAATVAAPAVLAVLAATARLLGRPGQDRDRPNPDR